MPFSNKIIETEVARLELDPRGFLIITLLDVTKVFDEEEAKRQIAAANLITRGESYKILVDASQSSITPNVEAKKLITSVDKKLREAVIVKSLGSRILSNIYLKLINRRYPCKIFNERQKAIEWLMEND